MRIAKNYFENKKLNSILINCFVGCLVLYSWLCFFPMGLLGYNLEKAKPYSVAVYDESGVLIVATCASDGQWRFLPKKVPRKFEKALIEFEDKRFYYHFGVDFIAIFRATFSNFKAKKTVSGASTITMQTVRLLENHPPRNFLQKISEALIALQMEARFSKKQILELYAANAPFGGNVVGLEAASWRYFNRSPETLTWAEVATLAVLPNQPSLVYPGAGTLSMDETPLKNGSVKSTDALLEKRNKLLMSLYEKKYFSADTLRLSLEEEVPKKAFDLPFIVPHYLEFLKKNGNGSGRASNSEKNYYTKINATLQKNATRILEGWSLRFSKKNINNAACIILDTKTKNVVAYCGNTGGLRNAKNYSVDLIQSRRSSGSLLKPFLYCAMLDEGKILPHQLVADIPTRIGNYNPENNIPVYKGVVPADEALSRSLNIPAVRELREYGISAFLAVLKNWGFSTFNRKADDYGLTLILGGGEITLYEAARAYAEMMNLATGEDAFFKSFPLVSARGRLPLNDHSSVHASQASCYMTLDALQKGVRPLDEAQWMAYSSAKCIAWKTGTSSGNRDAWAVGVTEKYTIGVWVGNAEGGGTKELTSVSTAAPVMFDLFSILPPTHWPAFPTADVEMIKICEKSGYIASENCEATEDFKPKNAPFSRVCPYCKTVTLTPDEQFQATVDDMTGEYAGKMPVTRKWFILPPTLEYYYTKNAIGYRRLPDFLPSHKAQKGNFDIVFPENNAHIAIPVEISGKKGSVVFEVASRNKTAEIFWDLDGEYLGSTKTHHQMTASPSSGRHILTATDSSGTAKSCVFNVIDVE